MAQTQHQQESPPPTNLPTSMPTKKTDAERVDASPTKSPLKKYTRAEVAKHDKEGDIWLIIENKVYDVTSWMPRHPGGSRIIDVQGGCDVTVPFLINHTEEHRRKKRVYLIGYICEEERTELSALENDMLQFQSEVRKEGLYFSDNSFYLKRCIPPAIFCALGWIFIFGQSKWSIAFAGAMMGLFMQQMAFFGHDLGHNSVTMSRTLDHLICSLLTATVGLSVSWWKINHHTHHAVTNSIEHDPDIQHLPFICINDEILKTPYWSKYYKKWFVFDRFTKFLITKQHYLIPIILVFSRLNLYVHSITTLLFDRVPLLNRIIESAGMIFYFGWIYCWARMPDSWQGTALALLVSHAVAGILLSIQIGISHWISPVVHKHPGDTEPDWFRHQISTTVDIDCYPMNDWLHGGLQFQTIHHCFPRIPRCRLRSLVPRLTTVLAKHGIEYPKLPFDEMIVLMWKAWETVAHQAAQMPVHNTEELKKLN